MRLTILTAGVLLSAGFAFAAYAVDEPKPLDDAKCDAAWTMASPGAPMAKCPPRSSRRAAPPVK